MRGSFPQGDLAVLEVQGAQLQPATFADSSHVEVGELALAIGTSAPINPGNSGGALVDETGAVIGVPTLAAASSQEPVSGIGFAISSNTVKLIAGQLAEHGEVVDSARAWLGASLRSLPRGGVIVAAVTHGGPAADAGIRQGELIVKIAGTRVQSVESIAVALAEQQPGDQVRVELSEDGGLTRTVKVTLGEIPPASG